MAFIMKLEDEEIGQELLKLYDSAYEFRDRILKNNPENKELIKSLASSLDSIAKEINKLKFYEFILSENL